MRFSRELTGLPVIHAKTGRELGRVREWLLDRCGEKVAGFAAEGSGWLPGRKVFSFQDIASLGKDAVLVNRDGQPATEPPLLDGHATCRVLGKRVLDGRGSELGVVEDVLFDERTGHVSGWRLSSGLVEDILSGRPVVEAQALLTIGEDVVIVQDEPLPLGLNMKLNQKEGG